MSDQLSHREDAQLGTRSLDRRRLLKAGAWAAPAIVLAAAVPAASASNEVTPGTTDVAWSDAFGPWLNWDGKIHLNGTQLALNHAAAASNIGTAAGALSYSVSPSPAGSTWARVYGPTTFTVNQYTNLQVNFGFALSPSAAVPADTYTITLTATFTSGQFEGKSVSTAFTVTV